ncbi:membrane protein [Rhodobacter phage RcCWillis]|nr:membrane protein [Rhodobacter phage RcCWillis]
MKALFWIGEIIGALSLFALPVALSYLACGLGYTCP